MEKAKIYLFTSPTCPHCPAAKRAIQEFRKQRDDFIYMDMSTMTPEGQRNAQKFGVMSVPTFIIKGPGYPDPIGLRGTQSLDSLNKFLDLSYGKETKREKKEIKIGPVKFSI